MVDKKLNQMYRVLKLIMVHFEDHEYVDGATTELFKEMAELDDLMKPVVMR